MSALSEHYAGKECIGDTPATRGYDSSLTKRPIGFDEARDVAGRLINSHFGIEPSARARIPADRDHDDDLLMIAFIKQQRDTDAELRKLLTGASHALKSYAYGNASPDLATSIAAMIDEALAKDSAHA